MDKVRSPGKHKVYEGRKHKNDPIGRENENNLWTLVEAFNRDKVDEDDYKVKEQNRTVAKTFKQLNSHQMAMEAQQKRRAKEIEKAND